MVSRQVRDSPVLGRFPRGISLISFPSVLFIQGISYSIVGEKVLLTSPIFLYGTSRLGEQKEEARNFMLPPELVSDRFLRKDFLNI